MLTNPCPWVPQRQFFSCPLSMEHLPSWGAFVCSREVERVHMTVQACSSLCPLCPSAVRQAFSLNWRLAVWVDWLAREQPRPAYLSPPSGSYRDTQLYLSLYLIPTWTLMLIYQVFLSTRPPPHHGEYCLTNCCIYLLSLSTHNTSFSCWIMVIRIAT